MKKRGQVTLFVIIAIIIVAIVALLFVTKPKIIFPAKEVEATSYIETCVSDSVNEAWDKLSVQGGYLEPVKNNIEYKNNKIAYLCYTPEWYRGCVMQEPFIRDKIESEINSYLKTKIQGCFDGLKTELEKKGNTVSFTKPSYQVRIEPSRIVTDISLSLDVNKENSAVHYDKFTVLTQHPADDLIDTTEKILNWEAKYGDFDQLTYMLVREELKIEKIRTEDSKIYIITDRNSKKQFIFATRSYQFPAGYWEAQQPMQ